MKTEYAQFLQAKMQIGGASGFEPMYMPDYPFDFQKSLIEYAVRKGRAAIFADCGLGKTVMELVWSQNIVQKTNRPVLLLTPLAVGAQMLEEADKFGIEAVRSRDGTFDSSARIVIANYEQLHKFDNTRFGGIACDESSILKNVDGKTKAAVIEFTRTLPYRLLCTATAAPNDYVELGTSSEALGELGYQDMITRFFVKENKKDYLGWGRASYRMRGHAQEGFWRWVCSWARACRKPSDLGFDDGKFLLPKLVTAEHEVRVKNVKPGYLFDVPARDLNEQREEQRRSLPERCEKAAELVDHKRPSVMWCFLNSEADMLEEIVKGSKQISGSDSDESKEETFAAFSKGQLKKLIIKPKIGAWGLNWQHCNHMTFFPSHSFEQFYQGVRRCWRFGQKKPVNVDIISTEGGARVLASLNRKSEAADEMFAGLVAHMNDSLRIAPRVYGAHKEEFPQWLSTLKS